MHEHLVDHDLEEQRGDEGKELQEERSDKHLREEPVSFAAVPCKVPLWNVTCQPKVS